MLQLAADGGQRHWVDATLREMLMWPMELAVLRPSRGALVHHLRVAAARLAPQLQEPIGIDLHDCPGIAITCWSLLVHVRRVAAGAHGEQRALEVVNRVNTSEGTQRSQGEQLKPALAGRDLPRAGFEADGLQFCTTCLPVMNCWPRAGT